MIRLFASHPTISNILMMAIIALGMNALPDINRESFPLLKPSKVQVTIAYPGATPSDVEEGICQPLEDATDGISFLEEQVCDARNNVAIFTLEMQESGDIREFTDDIKTEVDAIQNFPTSIEKPIIRQLGRTNPVASIAITSDRLTPSELKELLEYYRNRLIAMPEIPIVSVEGFSTHQLQVLIHPDTQRKYHLGVQDIANLIAAQAVELPAGTLRTEDTYYRIRFDNVRTTADELSELVILSTPGRGEIRLGDIAKIEDRFEMDEEYIELNGEKSGILNISKNTIDDTLNVADALKAFVEEENKILPEGTRLTLINDTSESVRDRLRLLIRNGWQGLVLATAMLLLFFSWRYAFWIAVGLPVSFFGGLAMMVVFGVSINMISMVALLMAIGILMDDAIVLSENIDREYQKGKPPLEAAIDGTNRVVRGVFSSYLTSAFLFGSLLLMKGDLGQVLGVLPVVLLSVLTISLIEAFLILPHHLKRSLEHQAKQSPPEWRKYLENRFDAFRDIVGRSAQIAMRYRYLTIGLAIAMLVFSVGLISTGTVKFKAFPDLEGNNVEARILLPQGTPFVETKKIVNKVIDALYQTGDQLGEAEAEELIKNVQVSYGVHAEAHENGSHIATLSVDILNTEARVTRMSTLIQLWKNNTGAIPGIISIQYKEPKVGPAGRAIHIRLTGKNLEELSRASWAMQNWLRGYQGIENLLDDLRPGEPQFRIKLKPGALAAGIDSGSVALQLRAAYLDVKIDEVYQGRESFEIVAKLDDSHGEVLRDFENFVVFSKSGKGLPLSSVATITLGREFSRIGHVNHERTVNIYGDVDADLANTSEIIESLKYNFLQDFQLEYPGITVTFKGEIENGTETRLSILSGFALGTFAVFLLLSLQFRNYREPIIVMVNIPLALIGAIWGHFIMGLDFTLPSMIGFVSLAGVVVNDSILLVEFVRYRVGEGLIFHDAAVQAVKDRFRAIFLTSVTTIAGMTPLLFETSTQALILVPLVTSIVFGMLTSTLLILLVLPALYAIMEDIGFVDFTKAPTGLVRE